MIAEYENILSEIKEKKAVELTKINKKITDLNETIEEITSKRNELKNQLYDIEAKFNDEMLAKCGENIDLLLNKWIGRENETRYFYINKIKKNFCRSERSDYLFESRGRLVSSISIEGKYFALSNRASYCGGGLYDSNGISYGNFEKKFETSREIFEFLRGLKEIKNSYTLKAFELMHSMLFKISEFKPIY